MGYLSQTSSDEEECGILGEGLVPKPGRLAPLAQRVDHATNARMGDEQTATLTFGEIVEK